MRVPFKGDKPVRKISKTGRILELRTFRWGNFSDKVWNKQWVCIFCGARYDDQDYESVEDHNCDLGEKRGYEKDKDTE